MYNKLQFNSEEKGELQGTLDYPRLTLCILYRLFEWVWLDIFTSNICSYHPIYSTLIKKIIWI